MNNKMNSALRAALLAILVCSFSVLAVAGADSKAAPTQQTFSTAEEAAQALIKATGDFDTAALSLLFGPEGNDLIHTGDPVADKKNATAFAELAKAKNTLAYNANKTRATIEVGENNWPLPIPLVNKSGKWSFDTKSGKQEVLYRRIGANELDAIQVCLGFVDAQKEYASTLHDGSAIAQYAQKLLSTPGKQDGLYWTAPDGSPAGVVSERVAKALADGYTLQKDSAYHGYYFKLLKGQGPAAPGGAIDYVIKGYMIGGFALAATPTDYRVTGVKTFIVNNDGIVYQKDLGPTSLEQFKTMELYNPDKSWHRTDDEWPSE